MVFAVFHHSHKRKWYTEPVIHLNTSLDYYYFLKFFFFWHHFPDIISEFSHKLVPSVFKTFKIMILPLKKIGEECC